MAENSCGSNFPGSLAKGRRATIKCGFGRSDFVGIEPNTALHFRVIQMFVLIRISDNLNWACVFNKNTGVAFVMSAITWKYSEDNPANH